MNSNKNYVLALNPELKTAAPDSFSKTSWSQEFYYFNEEVNLSKLIGSNSNPNDLSPYFIIEKSFSILSNLINYNISTIFINTPPLFTLYCYLKIKAPTSISQEVLKYWPEYTRRTFPISNEAIFYDQIILFYPYPNDFSINQYDANRVLIISETEITKEIFLLFNNYQLTNHTKTLNELYGFEMFIIELVKI